MTVHKNKIRRKEKTNETGCKREKMRGKIDLGGK